MRKLGKIGKRNAESNRKLKEIFIDKEITCCEMCGNTNMLSYAHKHKRRYYYPEDKQHLLYSFDEVLLLCIPCHEKIEYDKEKTLELFEQLR